jgi:tight adherence protein B
MSLPIIVGFFVVMAVATLLLGLGQALRPSEEVDERIDAWISERDQRRKEGGASQDEGATGTFLGRMESRVSGRSFESLRVDLAQANLSMTVGEYLLIRAGVVAACLVAGYLISHNFLSTLLMGVVGLFAPVLYVRSRRGRRLRAFNGQLPDVLDHLVGSLRAGYGLLQAVEWVSNQVPAPAGEEFGRVVREVHLGRGLSDSLDSLVRRIDSDDAAMIVTAIKIQYEVGGSLAEILEIVAETIRERVRIQREIRVLTAQQRYSGYVLMFLPIGVGLVLFMMSPEYMMQLFAPGPTLCIPIVTGIMMVLGFIAMRRIVEIEV